jgi:hypothetical protein
MLHKIDAWWAEFTRRADDLKRVFERELEMDLPAWMSEHLDAVDERLCWEFGPPLRGSGHRLVITSESHSELRPLVASLLERAPTLPGWEFYPYRPAESVEDALRTVEARVGRAYGDVQARVESASHNRVALTFRSADFESDEDKQARRAAFVLTESLLGEEAMDRWVGTIDVEPAPRPGPRRLFGRKEPPADADLLTLDRLQPSFAARVAAIQAGLPARPWHEVDLENQNHEWGGFELEPEDDDRGRADLITGITPFSELTEAVLAGSFRSERFSRFGETFCYLKIDGGDGPAPPNVADREPVEQAIDEVLIPSRLGRTIGGGTGRRHFYVELALADLERALPVLRGRLQALNVPRRSWLLFHDCELADEWVGVYEGGAPPPGVVLG